MPRTQTIKYPQKTDVASIGPEFWRRQAEPRGGDAQFSAAPGDKMVEGGPSKLLINKKTTSGVCIFEPGGREFASRSAKRDDRRTKCTPKG